MIKLFKENIGFLYYLIGEGLSKGIVFLSIPFFTDQLTKEEFGKLSLYWVSVPLLSVFLDLSQRSFVKYSYVNDKENIRSVLMVIKSLLFLNSIIVLSLILIKNILGVYLIDKRADLILALTAAMYAFLEINLSYYQIRGQYKSYNYLFLLRNGLPYVLTFITLSVFKSVYTFMGLQLVVFFLLVILFLSRSKYTTVTREFFLSTLKKSISFSLPFLPAMLSVLTLSFSDRFIINYYYSEIDVAEYTIAYTIGSVFMACFLATNKMWQKFILENLKNNQIQRISNAAKIYSAIIFLLGIIIILNKNILVVLISNDSYLKIVELVVPIVCGMFFYFLYTLISNIPFFYNHTGLMVIPAIVSAAVNLILNFVFIPEYGYSIAAYTTMISYILQFLILYFICLSKYNLDILFNVKR